MRKLSRRDFPSTENLCHCHEKIKLVRRTKLCNVFAISISDSIVSKVICYYRVQPKAGAPVLKCRRFAFSTLHCYGYIADLDISRARYFWECSLAHRHLKSTRRVKRKIIAFGE